MGAPRVPVGEGGVGGGNKRAAVGVAEVRVLVAVAGGGATWRQVVQVRQAATDGTHYIPNCITIGADPDP